MYFKLFNKKLPHLIDEVRKVTLPVTTILERIKPLKDNFDLEARRFYLDYQNDGNPTEKQINKFKAYKFLSEIFMKFIETCCSIINDYDGSIKNYFKCAKYKSMSRSSFYDYKRFFTSLTYKKFITWSNYFPNSTRPHNIHYKYSKYIQKLICDEYFSYDESDPNKFQNFTTFWKELANGERLSKYGDFSQISSCTLRKILSKDSRYKKRPRKPKKDHPFRDKPKSPGHAQMDVKVFGRNQTGVHWYVYSFDCVETQKRIPYSEILEYATTNKVMEVVERARIFYEKLGIKLTLIRTDNAMMFKNTNFVNSNQFNEWCKLHHIKHQFTPYGEPQADGCVERYHKCMDDELVPKLIKLKTYKDINDCLQRYNHWFTYERYMYYGELTDLPYNSRFMKPINAIEFFKTYKKKNTKNNKSN